MVGTSFSTLKGSMISLVGTLFSKVTEHIPLVGTLFSTVKGQMIPLVGTLFGRVKGHDIIGSHIV